MDAAAIASIIRRSEESQIRVCESSLRERETDILSREREGEGGKKEPADL